MSPPAPTATLCPISSGGPPSALIVMTTPRTAATMPNPGRLSAMVEMRGRGQKRLLVQDFEIGLHDLVQVMHLHAARQQRSHGVAKEVHGLFVLGEVGMPLE